MLPHVKFAYSRVVHSTTCYSPFEIVYGFNPLTPLDLMSLSSSYILIRKDGNTKDEYVRRLHDTVKTQIENKVDSYARQANKGRKKVVFEPSDWVWVHLRKERFPSQRKYKLLDLRKLCQIQIENKVDSYARQANNGRKKIAFEPDLLGEYDVSPTFNVVDLPPYDAAEEDCNLRSNSIQEGRNDEVI
uniref:Uncharacterized protein LOC105852929 n=1 Tax=Cicer arietinum TaxID=3827 RepID=A0A1S3EHA6_CICAR|nr:uncharacterized protein LOC105852929 [Cicer arietinum]